MKELEEYFMENADETDFVVIYTMVEQSIWKFHNVSDCERGWRGRPNCDEGSYIWRKKRPNRGTFHHFLNRDRSHPIRGVLGTVPGAFYRT